LDGYGKKQGAGICLLYFLLPSPGFSWGSGMVGVFAYVLNGIGM